MVYGLQKQQDYLTMTDDALVAARNTQNRVASSRLARVITGFPARRVTICWHQQALSDRTVPLRVYRPTRGRRDPQARLPLVLHVHGGGFVGTAVQCDWLNSHLAQRLPAVVVSVEHRLVSPGTPFSAAIVDGWDALQHLVRDAGQWGIDPERVAVVGESAGAAVIALAAIRARDAGLRLRAQVLVNPCLDLTSTASEYASMRAHATTPTLTVEQMERFRRMAVPPEADPRDVSPVHAHDLGALAPAFIVVPVLDPLADHGRTYADRLDRAGTPTQVAEHERAGHAFISMPHLVPAARPARRETLAFLHQQLQPATDGAGEPA